MLELSQHTSWAVLHNIDIESQSTIGTAPPTDNGTRQAELSYPPTTEQTAHTRASEQHSASSSVDIHV